MSGKAGVLVKTISQVLIACYVWRLTREKVEGVMQEMGYHPSIAARILAGTKSGRIPLSLRQSQSVLLYANTGRVLAAVSGTGLAPAGPYELMFSA
ncbi:MAG: LacI family DNA-binding transcriptional regulator [Parasphingorhabdus sp.]|nr:LacI family DNA-binding transcriptional regulator [Parasphingorhabdus sp.]